ncbi:anti-sigma regulatory factor [Oleidesulfovibrio sp.]|uniref:anti-sigma regulatory factor n=1 Tax=Oleidesulfovibrio sp. TaxID=2909707 RepID=UPI003A8ACCE7
MSQEFEVSEPADNARVVCGVRHMLAQMGFDKNTQYLIASAVSELGTNIIRYAGKGAVSISDTNEGGGRVFTVVAKDSGPGIEDVRLALEEHFTTGQGLGLGLPSVRRIMDDFEVCSGKGQGTTVVAKKWVSNRCTE